MGDVDVTCSGELIICRSRDFSPYWQLGEPGSAREAGGWWVQQPPVGQIEMRPARSSDGPATECNRDVPSSTLLLNLCDSSPWPEIHRLLTGPAEGQCASVSHREQCHPEGSGTECVSQEPVILAPDCTPQCPPAYFAR